jgi:hypothetical protein
MLKSEFFRFWPEFVVDIAATVETKPNESDNLVAKHVT